MKNRLVKIVGLLGNDDLGWVCARSPNDLDEGHEEFVEKTDSTLRSSQAVPHPSTNRALCCLTSEVERDPVHSTRYGRRRVFTYLARIIITDSKMMTVAGNARVRAPRRRRAFAHPRRKKGNRTKHPEHKTKNTRPETTRRKRHLDAKRETQKRCSHAAL